VRESQIVQEWKDEGVYPYKEAPKSETEKATRAAFHVVAMAASRTVEETRTKDAKALLLGALRQAFEHEPESLLPILESVTKLTKPRIGGTSGTTPTHHSGQRDHGLSHGW